MISSDGLDLSAIARKSLNFGVPNIQPRGSALPGSAGARLSRMLRCVTNYWIRSPLPMSASLRCAPALPDRIRVLVVPGLPALSTCSRSRGLDQ